MVLNDRNRILIAVAVIAASAAVIAMAFVDWHYESKIKSIRDAHRDEVSALRRHYKKDLKERDGVSDGLKKIDETIARTCKV